MEKIDSSKYQVGVPFMDMEHQVLIDCINDLIEAKEGSDLGLILQVLIDYTKLHFTVEEEIMRSYEYPGFDRHKMLHDGFREKVGSLSEISTGGNNQEDTVVSKTVLNYLKNWLVHHIDQVDRELVKFFATKSLVNKP